MAVVNAYLDGTYLNEEILMKLATTKGSTEKETDEIEKNIWQQTLK